MSSGETCPCTPAGGVDLADWNASHSRRWNHLRTNLRRRHPGLEFFRGVEVQKRGALHDHAMVWSPTPLKLSEVRRLAMGAGFGHSLDLAPVEPGSKREAYYVSKYITKATDVRSEVPWRADVVDVDTGEISSSLIDGRYRTWSMSRGWGSTMRAVREEGRRWREAQQQELEAGYLDLIGQVLGVDRLLTAGDVDVGESPPLLPA